MKTIIKQPTYSTTIMTDEEKQKTWGVISAQTFLKHPESSVRKPILSRLYYRGLLPVLRQQGVSFGKEKYALGVMLGTLIVSGTISVFAQDTLPGDILYPVKTNFNEKIQVVLAVTPEGRAQEQALLATRRLEEAVRLVILGKLSPSLADQTKQAFREHVDDLQSQLSLLEKKKEFKTIAAVGVFFQTRIAVHTAVLKDIEVHSALSSAQVVTDPSKRIVDHIAVLNLERSVLTSVVPTIVITKNALLEIATGTKSGEVSDFKENNKVVLRLNINHNEAKKYLDKLHNEIGIPSSTLKSIPAPIVPIFVPEAAK